MLKDYKRFITNPDDDDNNNNNNDNNTSSSSQRWGGGKSFHSNKFISSQPPDFQPFLQELCITQQFDDFITKRLYSPGEPDVKFFDQSITAGGRLQWRLGLLLLLLL